MDNRLLRLKKNKLLNIKVSHKKEYIHEWYRKYQAGDLKDEVRNYINFQNYILKKLLDYKSSDYEFEYPLDGRSVEFMIMKDNEPYIAVELKGTSTKDLTKRTGSDKYSAVEQASNYANKKSSIKWFIVSNYYEFRLYHHESQNRYISFNLDDLKPGGHDFDEKRIQQFLTVFSRKSVLEKDYLNKLYDSKGLFPEDFNLENEFYKLYNETRLMLIKELEESNQLDKHESIEYAQLILNRYIFICFCEDKDLLPDNLTTDEILTPIRRKVLALATIWSRLNELFYFINNGNPDNNITGYNGGLFKEEISHLRIRDKIEDPDFYKELRVKWSFPEQEHIIDHELRHYPNINLIYRNLLIISSFDFNTDLTENILGHIFENSISDLEELRNETKQSKRKKEGVYYTPEHITQYICENTIIPYLSNEDNNTIESLIKEYSSNIKELEDKLQDIKILDPACGSGAFLNKATYTLLAIHKAIFKLKHENKDNLDKEFDNIDNRRDILLNNIYGVDLNPESIEITKLGLFLKVCKKGLKLPDLDNNIKCGNSLINDPEYTDRPFDWEKEYSEIMANGGFDIVIGNPPYVRQEKIKELKPFLKDNYETYTGVADLYVYFFEKGLKLLKDNGFLAFICSNKYTRSKYGKNLREFILNYNITNYNDYTGKNVFVDATVDPSVITINKSKPKKDILINNDFIMDQNRLSDESWSFEHPNVLNLKDKITSKGTKIKDIPEITINYGIKTGFNEAFIIDEQTKKDLIAKDPNNVEIIKPVLRGRDIKRWNIHYQNLHLIFTRRGIKISEYPAIKEYLSQFKERLAPKDPKNKKQKIGRKPGSYEWYEIQDNVAYYKNFENSKIIWSDMASKPSFMHDTSEYYLLNTSYLLSYESNQEFLIYLISLFNSKLLYWYFTKISSSLGNKGVRYFKQFVDQLPIANATIEQQNFIIKISNEIMDKHKELHEEIKSFHKYLISDFNVSKINKKLTEYYNLSFEDFYKEVRKQYKKITRREKDKLEKEYIESIAIIPPLQKEIANIDNEIDSLVYDLYDLTDEEIKIIEESFSS